MISPEAIGFFIRLKKLLASITFSNSIVYVIVRTPEHYIKYQKLTCFTLSGDSITCSTDKTVQRVTIYPKLLAYF